MRAHAAGFTPGEFDWPATWTHRAGRDRTPSIPGHELSGTVVELGWGTTGLTAGGIVDRGCRVVLASTGLPRIAMAVAAGR